MLFEKSRSAQLQPWFAPLLWLMVALPCWLYAAPTAEQMALYNSLSPAQQAQARSAALGGGAPSSVAPPLQQEPDAVVVVPVPPKERAADKAAQQPFTEALDKPTLVEEKQSNVVAQKSLEPYGYDLFSGTPTTFAPATDIPIPSEYIVGPGDSVNIALYGRSNLQHQLVISRDGILNVPDIGPIAVAGQRFDELTRMLNSEIERKLIGVKASITMGALRSIRVFVMGEARRPGSYTVSSLSTMTNALFVSGGIMQSGSLRTISLKRKGNTIATLDLYDLLLSGDTSQDQRLLPGDVIFIPPVGQTVGVAGKVRRPGIYELNAPTDVGALIAMAGGMLPDAYPAATQIERVDAQADEHLLVNIGFKMGGKGFVTPVQNGDVVRIYGVNDRSNNMVDVVGHLPRPGAVEWREGMRLSDLFPSMDALLPRTVPDYLLIEREVLPLREVEVLVSRLDQALTNPSSSYNYLLQPRDRVRLFGLGESRSQSVGGLVDRLRAQARFGQSAKVVGIKGIVRHPGEYPLTPHMRVTDLINASGRLQPNREADYIILQRIDPQNGRSEVLQIGLNALAESGGAADLPLQPQDRVTIFSDNMGRSEALAPLIDTLVAQAREGEPAAVTTIAGSVRYAGSYPYALQMRVTDLIQAAGGVPADTEVSYLLIQRTSAVDGTVSVLAVDTSALYNPHSAHDPLLQPNDRLYLFSVRSPRQELLQPLIDTLQSQAVPGMPAALVSITGVVKHPGDYPLTLAMRLSQLIRAGVLGESAHLSDAELTRYQLMSDGTLHEHETRFINPQQVLAGGEEDLVLQPFDRLMIKQVEQWKEDREIELGGEFRFPGIYRFGKGDSLQDVIKRAGGFTEYAYLEGSVFLRARVLEKEKIRLKELDRQIQAEVASLALQERNREGSGQQGDVKTLAETSAMLTMLSQQLSAVEPQGRLVIDLVGLMSGKFEPLLAEAGDRLYIPAAPVEVSVLGQVHYPTSHFFDKSMGLRDYINQSGGVTAKADEEMIYVVRASGAIESAGGLSWFGGGNADIKRGDTIVVPQEVGQVSSLSLWTSVSQILYQLGVAAAAWKTVGAL